MKKNMIQVANWTLMVTKKAITRAAVRLLGIGYHNPKQEKVSGSMGSNPPTLQPSTPATSICYPLSPSLSHLINVVGV